MNRSWLHLVFAVALLGGVARADTTTSYTGTLMSPDNATGTFDGTDSFLLTLNLAAVSDVTLQTYGFGGGMNGAGTVIPAGGTDPFVGLFSGTGDGAVFIDGDWLTTANYTPGCPPAATVSNFGHATCGDVRLTFNDLAAGSYTVLLSDGQFIPCAADNPGCSTLGDGATDLTAGIFCNADDPFTNTHCPNTSGDWALDVTVGAPTLPPSVPEPGSLILFGTGLLGAAGCWRRRRRSRRPEDQSAAG